MPYQVAEAEEADMERLFTIIAKAFASNEPFFDIMYPQHWTPEGRKIGGERFLKVKTLEYYTKFVKAFNPSTGEIIGAAKWNIYNGKIPDSEVPHDTTNYWKTESDQAIASFKGAEFVKSRNAHIAQTNGHLLSLDILAIDPAYQRKGAGGMLVKWGTDEADRQGVDTTVESSVFGKGLYEKNGFVFHRDVVLPDPPEGQPAGEMKFAWLIRPKKTAA